ncbi:MAG: DNA-binding response regulator [Sulfobacillus acidophilus]|uniref:Stage 0 sporulation protein A homolog n=1 Tax=Sulfobacillus acidophilus TaxID=53633 RepID=A0A2T2WHZ8_9FIRM|nr:MAG: DNA-binding response regulator [Sulfobacillus acidophilus]
MQRTILVVDDEPSILTLIRHRLEHDGLRVLTAGDGLSALQRISADTPDLLVLDLMLPGMPGLEVLRTMRQFSAIPVILLSARNDEVDRVVGLEMGADDYVTKPFSVRELAARVKAVFRRQELRNETGRLVVHEVSVNLAERSVSVQGQVVALTTTEFEILTLLMRNPGRVFSREELFRQVWNYEVAADTRTINVHIKNLRGKLQAEASLIETVRGVGYRIRP